MKILVINAGSSSLKYQLIDMTKEEVLAKGNCERIGLGDGIFGHKTADGREKKLTVDMPDHIAAFMQVKNALVDAEVGVIKDLSEVTAVGHRVVQGGMKFMNSVLINQEVIDTIEELIPLAPLHNSVNLQGIRACQEVFGDKVPQVAVFDTAFHSTMPAEAYIYPIPYEYFEKYQIRRYGFHGTSHRFVSERCAELVGKPMSELKIITCHLGNGSSIAAVNHGKVIDTSMGLTPLDGFMMGTRCGSLDPSVVTFIEEKENLTAEQMSDILNKKSGLLGISGISSDDRDVTKAVEEGQPRAILAHKILVYQIKKFVGSYAAAMNGCDAIVFTAGLGENQVDHRQNVCDGLTYLGVEVSRELNDQMIRGKGGKISTPNSKVQVFVIPTNEELVIARDTKEIVNKL